VFSGGVFMLVIPPACLVDPVEAPPTATPKSVWLDGRGWEIPTPDNADVFIAGSNSPRRRIVLSGQVISREV
jgi:hypothetical protein